MPDERYQLIKALFSRISRHLDELDAMVDERIGFWLPRHKYTRDDLLEARIFTKIDAWCETLEPMVYSLDDSEKRDVALLDYYHGKRSEMEEKLGRIRVKIRRRPDTFGDAVFDFMDSFLDRVAGWIGRGLGIQRVGHNEAKRLRHRDKDED